MMQLVEELNTLRLDVLDEDWVQGIYYSEFLEFGEFPSEYESILESLETRRVFHDIMHAIDNWLHSDEPNEDKSWAALSQYVPHQKLLAVLAYFIDYGTRNIVTKEYRNNALLASRVYYKFLSISGYKAYHIYHSQLFAQSLACLGYPKALCEHEENYFNRQDLTAEVNSIIKELRMFVLDLRAIIESLQLNPEDMNFEDILSNLVDVTGGAIVNKLHVDKIELAKISQVIYQIIDILICDASGEPNTSAIQLLFKTILPKLVAASVDTKNANNLVRASYVTYSGLLLSRYGKAALPGFTVLLQHLCHNHDGLERSEVRQARVSLVVGLMSFLPNKTYRATIKWLLELSTTGKTSHRHIALEMLAKLLTNDPEEEKPNEDDPDDPAPTEKPDSPVDKEGETPKDPTEAPAESETAPAAGVTEDESSQDSQSTLPNPESEISEEDIAGLLRQRPQTAPYARILRAVYERVNDSSSALRTRAFHILADCLQSDRLPMKRAIQELNGSGSVSRLMGIAARGVCDERAAVRRAALTLIQRSLAAADVTALASNSHDLGILVSLCRDASLLVRGAAVAAIGELTTERPCDAMFDALLTGPVHQLSDPETRVQEQVGGLVEQLLINRLQKYESGSNEDPRPWMFLASVTRHNMRRHLQKAFALLAKTTRSITLRTIDILSTHLGTGDEQRDLHALVFLTSAAKYVDYHEIKFVLDYYYKISEDNEIRDARLLRLTLELLTTWSRWARLAERTALRNHLVTQLATAHDNGCRLSCAALASHLDPHDLTWATELLQMAERRAVSCNSAAEWVRAADLSLVAPTPPTPALLQLLLCAVDNPPTEWSEAERGCAVAGLGRLCVRSRAAAAAAAPKLARVLQDARAPLAPRLNSLLALTDICTRYTCIVEPLLECVCVCLEARAAAELRRGAARCLTRLLLAGFLRLRTPLYYRYCALLADDDHDVREPAEYYVTCCLAADAIYHHFVDCVLHYNSDQPESISFDARQLIYDVMLQRLSLVQRLNVQCRLATEVLEHAADMADEGDGELSAALSAALLDTITLLCGPRMKLPKKPEKSNGDPGDIDDLQERVTTNIVSHKMKRTVAEVLVPAVLKLYAKLGPRGGQVAAYLVRIANDLLADYRQEIEELIEIDEELVERVRHFQDTIGVASTIGNTRNLVTSSTTHEPETPKATRKRGSTRAARSPPRKRALRI